MINNANPMIKRIKDAISRLSIAAIEANTKTKRLPSIFIHMRLKMIEKFLENKALP